MPDEVTLYMFLASSPKECIFFLRSHAKNFLANGFYNRLGGVSVARLYLDPVHLHFIKYLQLSLLFCIDQVVLASGEERVPSSVPSLVSQPRQRWLNIVLDLNGVLCEASARSSVSERV